MAHTQGKRHQTNLAKRAAREAKDAPALPQPNKRKVNIRKTGKSSISFPRALFFIYFLLNLVCSRWKMLFGLVLKVD